MTRGALFALLHAACAHAARSTPACASSRRARTAAALVDAAGSEYGPFDLIVVADGANSALRAASGAGRARSALSMGRDVVPAAGR